jgi:hypothetical protein
MIKIKRSSIQPNDPNMMHLTFSGIAGIMRYRQTPSTGLSGWVVPTTANAVHCDGAGEEAAFDVAG